MNRILKRIGAIFAILFIVVAFVGCKKDDPIKEENYEIVDYASQLKLDLTTTHKRANVTVLNYIDGDTTHFNISKSEFPEGVLKARYLAVNTPESTGQIEPWGKAASVFTKERLSKATSIIVESESSTWNFDSTGSRYLVWVWYKTSESSDYVNLNLELLQNGLAKQSNTSRTIYGDICVKAYNQAKNITKLNMHSGEKDPGFYYGSAQFVSLKELRCHQEKYKSTSVSFDANVVKDYGNALYVEDFDEESGIYFGMYIFYGYQLGNGKEIIAIGNRVRFVGSFQYYEAGGTYQLADLKYQLMRPDDPTNIKLLTTGNEISFTETSPVDFNNKTVKVEFVEKEIDEETKEEIDKVVSYDFDYAFLRLNSSISMKDLYVQEIYTTQKDSSSSKGAMTLTCVCGDETITIRTVVLYDDQGNLVTEDALIDKTIDVKGYVDYYEGNYQIKVFSINDINIK